MNPANWPTRTEHGYGFFPGGDPRSFSPDEESCTPEEIAAHKAACEAWDAGTTLPAHAGCRVGGGIIVCGSAFGVGSYEYKERHPPDTRYWRRREEFYTRQAGKRVDRLVTRERQRRAWRLMVRP